MRDRVYFDESDESADGLGWNVVQGDVDGGGAIAARYATEAEARAAAR